MDTEQRLDLGEQNTDEMRLEIDCTRAAMTDKLEALEDRMMGTVQSAQETVEDSIQMAKDTVATVKRNFDVRYQVEQHPWAMVGGSFIAGLALSGLFRRSRRQIPTAASRLTGGGTPLAISPRPLAEQCTQFQEGNGSLDAAPSPSRPQAPSANRNGFFGPFQEEINQVKGMAIGYLMGLLRDSIQDAAPQLAPQFNDVMNSVTTKLGDKPVQERST